CWLFHYCCSHALQQYASSSGFRGLIFVSFLERISPTVLPGSLQSRAACGARPEAGASATASPCANTRSYWRVVPQCALVRAPVRRSPLALRTIFGNPHTTLCKSDAPLLLPQAEEAHRSLRGNEPD